MSQSADLRELARRLLRVADDLEVDEQTRRYIRLQIDLGPDRADLDAFDRAVSS